MGEPDDVSGQCNAHLYIADNFGDNHATMRCQLPRGHPAHHQEGFDRPVRGGRVLVQWEKDERTYPHQAAVDADGYCETCGRHSEDEIHTVNGVTSTHGASE